MKCTKCGTDKSLNTENFTVNNRYISGFSTWCKNCQREYRVANKHRRYKYPSSLKRSQRLVLRYGITQKQYDSMLAKQDKHCALCPETKGSVNGYLDIDHDHSKKDKHVRGLLCNKCNSRLGHVEKVVKETENITATADTWLYGALKYLQISTQETQYDNT